MAEEETFECVFGYGDCSIRALMAKERKQSMMMMKTIPIDLGKDMPKEMAQGLNLFMQGMVAAISRAVQAMGDLGQLGSFCAACPKPRKEIETFLNLFLEHLLKATKERENSK